MTICPQQPFPHRLKNQGHTVSEANALHVFAVEPWFFDETRVFVPALVNGIAVRVSDSIAPIVIVWITGIAFNAEMEMGFYIIGAIMVKASTVTSS